MKKRPVIQTLLPVMLVCVLVFSSIPQASALTTVTANFAGISDYETICGLDDRAGRQYVEKFSAGLQELEDDGRIYYNEVNLLSDNEVTRSSLLNEVDRSTTLFAFSGHGLAYTSSPNNALHTAGSPPHTDHYSDNWANLKTTDTSFKSKYVVLYTCNQLVNGGSQTKYENILKTMNGTRLIFGFASTMYLHSDEATTFVYRMGWFSDMIEAYKFSTAYYQDQRISDGVYSRVVGYIDAADDNLRVYESFAPVASIDLTKFDILDTQHIPGISS